MIRNFRIQDWLQSVRCETEYECIQPPTERPAKRTRIDEPLDPAWDGADRFTADTPVAFGTPSLTEAGDALSRSQKRSNDEMEMRANGNMSSGSDGPVPPLGIWSCFNLDPEQSPKAYPTVSLPSSIKRAPPESPKNPISVFTVLEKPINIAGTTSAAMLPRDVQCLYTAIQQNVKYRQAVIPYGVKEQGLVDDMIPSSFFASATDIDPVEARLIHATLCRIMRAAVKSERCYRHEAAWNNVVHTPLLELLCGQREDTEFEIPLKRATAGFEPMMASTISGNSIPRLAGQGNALACSVSVISTEDPSAGTPETLMLKPHAMDLNQVHSSSNSKTVDYALILELPKESMLFRCISDLTNELALRDNELGPHVNHTSYPPVQYAPIAASIATKSESSSQDPLIQLGIWTAAWHKRMLYLRSQLTWSGHTMTKQQLISLPLIRVVGHQWHVFFACDGGDSITIYGPISLGSTDDLISLYVLFASLKAIKAWIESEFYEGMKAWFNVEQEPPRFRASN
ncbi:hypothetical protein SAMD00023353_6700460 [Rosellinia necatrix]|uniref:PD-(D/E)XK nuclease-like domain-containing protein n=1 Tax=Rosellinia necatrix TaxID=77044 RepID=A0A1W2TTB9_ROSNE|nr:hypothetical protein SAMD00023353_6700460 [Rosellinia necatrix]